MFVLKVRIKYTKSELLKFIGHLDVMRYFQKVVKRAGFDIAYSQGFSPHQLMSFAAPLALGVTSEGEYFDAEFNSLVSSEEFVRRFNEQMSAGMEVKAAVLLPDNAKKAMSIVTSSDYLISIEDSVPKEIKEKLLAGVSRILEHDTIEVLKKTKKSEKIEDIKPGIHKLSVESYVSAKKLTGDTHSDYKENGNQYVKDIYAQDKIYMLLSAGSEYHLKPEWILQAICKEINYEYNRFDFRFHRLETYTQNENQEQISLLETGEIITEV